MQSVLRLKIQTLSNLFIGGAPTPFEIGGIDQYTATDPDGFPYIPASSLKGALRAIVREDEGNMENPIALLYAAYLKKNREDNQPRIRKLIDEKEAPEAIERMEERYTKAEKELSSQYLFGIEGFNNTPRLLFSDLLLCRELRDKKICFSIDMKNSIDDSGAAPVSNPRTYKAARSGLAFEGEIRLYRLESLGESAAELCKSYVLEKLMKFNDGIHRLGNSKSRGYGKIQVTIENERGGLKI